MALDDHLHASERQLSAAAQKSLCRLPMPLVYTNLSWAAVAFCLLMFLLFYILQILNKEGSFGHAVLVPALGLLFWRLLVAMNAGVQLQRTIQWGRWDTDAVLEMRRQFWRAQGWMLVAWAVLAIAWMGQRLSREEERLPDFMSIPLFDEPGGGGFSSPPDWVESILDSTAMQENAERARRIDSIMRDVQESLNRLNNTPNGTR